MAQSDDMAAIKNYFSRTVAITPEAAKIQDAFNKWYDGLGWFDINMTPSVYNEARQRRNSFSLANVKSTAERLEVERVISTGMTTEEMQAPVKPLSQYTPTTAKPGSKATIRQGSSGEIVKEWQRLVKASPIDGKFGPGTHAKTIEFQKSKGLVADGIVGPKTWSAMLNTAIDPKTGVVVEKVEPGRMTVEEAAVEAVKQVSKPVTTSIPQPKPPTTVPPKPTVSKPVSTPKPISTPKPVVSKPVSTPTPVETPKVVEAGMLGSLKNMPTWKKVVGGALTATALFFGYKTYKERSEQGY